MTHRRLILYSTVNGVPKTRTVEAKCVHRISGASKRNVKISTRSCGVSMHRFSRGKIRRKFRGKEVVKVFVHKYCIHQLSDYLCYKLSEYLCSYFVLRLVMK